MDEAVRDLFIFIGILVLMFFVWLFTGGPTRYISQKGPFLEPPAPISSGDAYGIDPTLQYVGAKPGAIAQQSTSPSTQPVDPDTGAILPDIPFVPQAVTAQQIKGIEGSTDRVQIFRGTTDTNRSVNGEYLIIFNPENKPAFTLTGTTLESDTLVAHIGGAADLPLAGTAAHETPVVLPPGGFALIETGVSPLGFSFRINDCSGYLGQFLSFTPRIKKECPTPLSEAPAAISQSCPAFLGAIPRCSALYYGAPISQGDATQQCISFAQTQLSYNSCATRHSGDAGFKQKEWRIYLGSSKRLWDNKNDIKLFDGNHSLLGRLAR